jgi:MarR family transcriptional regulator for hemolysin
MESGIEGTDRLLTSKEAAAVLNVSPSWLARARRRKQGPEYVEEGGKLMYRFSALEAWIARSSDESVPLNIRQVFGSRLGYTARQWRRAVNERLLPFGLTDATWLPLLHVARGRAPMRQKDLAESIGIESSTLVRLIDALDQAGLIERRTEDDRRARTLRLTPRGRELVEHVDAATAEVRRQILAGISDEDLAITLRVIERICAALTRARAPERADEP